MLYNISLSLHLGLSTQLPRTNCRGWTMSGCIDTAFPLVNKHPEQMNVIQESKHYHHNEWGSILAHMFDHHDMIL